MMKSEFTALIKGDVTNAEYEKIEFVYNYHPSINNVGGKKQIADLYNSFGMRIILDMYATAEKAAKIENDIQILQQNLAVAKQNYKELQEGRI